MTRSLLRRLAVLSAATLAAAVPSAARSATVTPATGGTEVLGFDRLPGLDRLPSRPAAPDQQMLVALGLRNPNQAAERRLYERLYDLGDPLYHQFLTPAEVGRRFGVSSAQRTAALRALRGAGLSVVQESTEGDWVAAEGTVAAVERGFAVHLREYSVNGRDFIANVEGPTVPRAESALTVIGLNTWQAWHLPARPARTAQDGCVPGVCVGATTPQDLWSVYGQPPRDQGQGQSMAIIGEGDPTHLLKGLRNFERTYHLPVRHLRVVCTQSHTCGSDTSGDGEWYIDTQASTGMAPLASETLYFAQGLEDPKLDTAFLAWINDPNGPKQASASEGVCEETPLNPVWRGPLEVLNGNDDYSKPLSLALGDDQQPVIDQALLHATVEGRTLFASTGDGGFTCGEVLFPGIQAGNGILYDGNPQVEYPASSPSAVAVGGTVLYTDGAAKAKRVLEHGWSYSGGGTSLFQPRPAYQAHEPHVVGQCISSPTSFTSGGGGPCRGIPDVAAVSGDILNGYTTCDYRDFCGNSGGTSLSSPLWLGMWTRAQSAAASAGPRGQNGLGFANETIYALGDSPRDFNDITLGDNGYPALAGWDYVTGFGSPHLAAFIDDALIHAHLKRNR